MSKIHMYKNTYNYIDNICNLRYIYYGHSIRKFCLGCG